MPTFYCDAILFDQDGVLVDSETVVSRHWRAWAVRHGLDPDVVLANAHGQRVVETVGKYLPEWSEEAVQSEADALAFAEGSDLDGVVPFAGAADLLRALPPGHWAVATSGTRHTATGRYSTLGLPEPTVFVTADDVARGKPDPEPYRRAAEGLGFDPARCIVFEDSPAGIRSAQAAGAVAIGIATTHPPEAVANADRVIAALADARIVPAPSDSGYALAITV